MISVNGVLFVTYHTGVYKVHDTYVVFWWAASWRVSPFCLSSSRAWDGNRNIHNL